jgi:hypothetical protein
MSLGLLVGELKKEEQFGKLTEMVFDTRASMLSG